MDELKACPVTPEEAAKAYDDLMLIYPQSPAQRNALLMAGKALMRLVFNSNCTQQENKPLIISLPCKVGSTVYVIAKCEEIMMHQDNDYLNGTGEVTCPFESNCDYEECNNQNVQIFETVVSSFMVEKDYIAFWTEHLAPEYRMDDFGRTVFLTREEAEKALVEQGDSHEKD